MKRPTTLAQTAQLILAGYPSGATFRSFLDAFYLMPIAKRASMVAEEPVLTQNARNDAMFAATAEYFAEKYNFPVPPWCHDMQTRFLHEPYYPCGLESMKAVLLRDSPEPFRRRMIFVESDPFYRPRKETHEPSSTPTFR